MRFRIESEILVNLLPNLIGVIRVKDARQNWLRESGLEANKKSLVLNFPSFILRIHTIRNVIILREIVRRNDGIDDETLQFV